MVEVNSETDFVARNAEFQELVAGVAEAALATDGSLAAILAAKLPAGATVEDAIKAAVATIGENMTLRRAALIAVEHGRGRDLCPQRRRAGPRQDRRHRRPRVDRRRRTSSPQIGRQVAMHVAAANPLAVRAEELDPAVVARERAIFAEQARESGKPEAIIEKMVEGRIRKFYEEVVLLSQAFVVDTEKTVEKALKAAEADVGGADHGHRVRRLPPRRRRREGRRPTSPPRSPPPPAPTKDRTRLASAARRAGDSAAAIVYPEAGLATRDESRR